MKKPEYHDAKGANEMALREHQEGMDHARMRLMGWELFNKYLRIEAPNIAAFLEKGQVVSITDDTVVVGFWKHQAIARHQVQKWIKVANHGLSRVNGRDILIKIIELDG